MGLHELAPQYRQFYHIFEAFKIADHKPDIAPPILATPTSLASARQAVPTIGDQFQEENEDGDDVSALFTCGEFLLIFFFLRKSWMIDRSYQNAR